MERERGREGGREIHDSLTFTIPNYHVAILNITVSPGESAPGCQGP